MADVSSRELGKMMLKRLMSLLRMKFERFIDDGYSFVLGHIVDDVQDVVSFAIRSQDLEHLMGDLISPCLVCLFPSRLGVFLRIRRWLDPMVVDFDSAGHGYRTRLTRSQNLDWSIEERVQCYLKGLDPRMGINLI